MQAMLFCGWVSLVRLVMIALASCWIGRFVWIWVQLLCCLRGCLVFLQRSQVPSHIDLLLLNWFCWEEDMSKLRLAGDLVSQTTELMNFIPVQIYGSLYWNQPKHITFILVHYSWWSTWGWGKSKTILGKVFFEMAVPSVMKLTYHKV